MRVLRRFPYLANPLSRIATHEISRLYLEGPDGESTVIESDAPAALMIRRVEFDALLVSLAVEAGAELVTGVDIVQARDDHGRITLTARDGRRFESSTVVAADGVHSVVARRLGLNRGWPSTSVALDMMEETPRAMLRDVDPSTLWVAYGFTPTTENALFARSAVKRDPVAEGYAYIFPKRDHVNIGIGYVLSYFRDAVEHAPYDLQRGLVDRLRSRGVVAGDSVRANFTPFLIPIGGPLTKPGRGRVLLSGDAGGFVNGLTAEGIYYAMVSGELAAATISASWPSTTAELAEPYRRSAPDRGRRSRRPASGRDDEAHPGSAVTTRRSSAVRGCATGASCASSWRMYSITSSPTDASSSGFGVSPSSRPGRRAGLRRQRPSRTPRRTRLLPQSFGGRAFARRPDSCGCGSA